MVLVRNPHWTLSPAHGQEFSSSPNGQSGYPSQIFSGTGKRQEIASYLSCSFRCSPPTWCGKNEFSFLYREMNPHQSRCSSLSDSSTNELHLPLLQLDTLKLVRHQPNGRYCLQEQSVSSELSRQLTHRSHCSVLAKQPSDLVHLSSVSLRQDVGEIKPNDLSSRSPKLSRGAAESERAGEISLLQ